MTAAVPTTEKYVAFARRGQEIATAAAEGYAGAFKTYADTVIPQGAQPRRPAGRHRRRVRPRRDAPDGAARVRHRRDRPRQGGR